MKIQEAISLAAKLEGPDQSLFTELVYGVTRMRRLLDKRLEKFCERPLEETEPEVRTVLRLGLYQSMFLTRIPDYALTNEAVTQVGLLGAPFAMGFVNAVLRRANDAKNKGALPGAEEKEWSIGLRHSHPDWLVERWAKRLTPERLEAVLDADNKAHPVFLQVPPERREEAMDRLIKAGVTVELVDFPTHTLRVSGPMGPLLEHETLLEGPWVVQDWTFQVFLDRVPALEGARVWDVCAAPGGKTAGLAWRVGNAGQVTATDASSDRIKMLRQTVARLGLSNVRILEMEADHFPAAERFQSIWVDAPCSGTGVLSRRADLRWRITAADVDRQAKRQAQLLEAAAPHVYPDGFLAYSTCSLEPEENHDIVSKFQKAHPEFETVPLTLPPFITDVEGGSEGLLVWPSAERDGGFLALFHRKT
jgi:16S rRNA (cytosine967-C5)-methyltransferase